MLQSHHGRSEPRHQGRGWLPVPRLQVPPRRHERRQGGEHQLAEVLGRPRRLLRDREPGGSSAGLPARVSAWEVSLSPLVHDAIEKQRL